MFFRKISKNVKPFMNLAKKGGKRTKLIKLEMKKGISTQIPRKSRG
jgi:hypothetical protein